jgi:two-component system, chemotaxis family, sensor kinase Cph1
MNESIDLTACEHEPITIPGSVQPHGVLLVLRGTDLTVVQASANLSLFLGVAPSVMLGLAVGLWLDEASANRLGEMAQRDDPGRANPLLLVGRFAPGRAF